MREYAAGRPLVFNHIPKSAGNSLRVALQQCLGVTAVRGVDLSLLGGYDDLDGIRPGAQTAFFHEPADLPADAMLVSGHIAPGTTMPRYPGADHITLLRIPQVRMLSQWLHGRGLTEFDLRHWGPSADAFRVAWLPLRSYLEHSMIAPNVDNTITRFLAFPHPALSRTAFIDEAHEDELVTAALDRLESFGFVGVVENPDFMNDLGGWLGRALPVVRVNERSSVLPRRRTDFATELDGPTRELLDHRCRLDVQVWRQVAHRVLPSANPDDLLHATLEQAVARYTEMLRTAPRRPLTRREVAVRVYEVGARLRPRRPVRTANR